MNSADVISQAQSTLREAETYRQAGNIEGAHDSLRKMANFIQAEIPLQGDTLLDTPETPPPTEKPTTTPDGTPS